MKPSTLSSPLNLRDNVQFWNVKIVSRRSVSPALGQVPETDSTYVEEEQRESPASLKDKQIRMEQQVYRIWTCVFRHSLKF